MTEPIRLNDKLKEYLLRAQGRDVNLNQIRKDLQVDPSSPAHDGVRVLMYNLAHQKIVSASGKNDGVYHVVRQIKPVLVFGGNNNTQPFDLRFPKDFDTGMEMAFADSVILREGDLILISGLSNFGKTTLALQFCAENIDKHPVLMGNEYTTLAEDEYRPTPRFLTRLESMDWVEWVDQDGKEKFTLLPVRDDYAEHIVKDRINIIDWVNIATGEHYMIGNIMESVKKELGRGVGIIVIQKAEGADAGRGGQFTKDFTDCELLIDKLNESETLLTIGKVKEYSKPVSGKSYAYGISKGVKIINFREVKRCAKCHGKGYFGQGRCDNCEGKKFLDV